MNDERTAKVIEAAQKVVDAIEIAGPRPDYHDAAWVRLGKEWPTLTKALSGLGRALKDKP